ncbi:MAG: transposase [Verrucomicrobiota bacterium]
MSKIIAIQERLRPALQPVLGCKDYEDEKRLLERVDTVLRRSGVERMFLELSQEHFDANAAKMEAAGEEPQVGVKAIERYLKRSAQALRCTVLKNLVGGSYREMSKALAMSPLYRWFCGLEEFAVIRVPGKSTVRDYAHWLPAQQMEKILATLSRAVCEEDRAREIGLESELDLSVAWVDTTCLKACIHFPTDWVLLRDAVRTLVKCILTIRRHGLKRRIPEPEAFLRQINALSMGMSVAARRKPGSKKERKRVLRAIKRLSKLVEEHGQRYRALLDGHWRESDLSRKEAEVILRRMDNVLGQLPQARSQAHERIIGGRKVANEEKILSLYESDLHVIVRGKAGAEVEFGNSLYLAENADGFILDHELKREISEGDAKWLQARYAGMKEKSADRLCGVVADRGFESKASRRMLDEEGLFNGICPRDPRELARRMREDELFNVTLRRRAQTEARVAVLKNVFLGGIPRAKGFENRQLQVAWAVLSHNLWVLARLPWACEQEAVAEAA